MTVTAHRFKATWRSLTFNAHYDDSGLVDDPAHVDISVQDKIELQRLEAVQVTVADYRELRQYLEGADPNEAFEGVRILRLRGNVCGSTFGKLEDAVASMDEAFSVAACRAAFLANDPKGLGALDFKLQTNGGIVSRRFYARPATGRPIVIGQARSGLVLPYVAELVAFDPFIYAQTLTQTTLTGSGGTVTNAGNIYTKPKIVVTFTGAGATNLTIANSTTGQTFVLNASTAANGEAWILDAARSTLYRFNDGANRYSQRVSGWLSQMFLAAGANTIALSNMTNVSSVRFDFRSAYA